MIEAGRDVEFIKVGDLCSVPFNIACGRCRNCKEGKTGICLNVNPARPGAAYGYVDMGGWVGGQAEYVMVPYADFNLLKFPDNAIRRWRRSSDLTLLSDIFPTGYHGAVTAGVGPGSTVYVAGAGPVGLACAAACHLLGAAVVIVGDMIPERLAQAKSFGCETIDLRRMPRWASRSSRFSGCRKWMPRSIASALKRAATARDATREAPGDGAEFADDGHPRRRRARYSRPVRHRRSGRHRRATPRSATLGIRIGLGWAKSHTFTTGQCPVMKYNRQLMMAILHDKIQIAKAVNVTVDLAGRSAAGLQGLRQGCGQEVRARSARHGCKGSIVRT